MKRQDNPELKRKILSHLANLYHIKEVREPNHLSSYVYCRTRTFLDQKQSIEPTDEEVMLFALGYGLQDVLTPKGATAQIHEKDGIIYRPDMTFEPTPVEIEQLIELKTTRKSAKNHYIDDFIPLTWLDYMKGGCYIRGTNQYDLIVLYMMGNYGPPFPQLYCDTFTFDDAEIVDNWAKIISRKHILADALQTNTPPSPYLHCYDWECKYCRHSIVCESLVRVLGLPNRNLEEDKNLWS